VVHIPSHENEFGHLQKNNSCGLVIKNNNKLASSKRQLRYLFFWSVRLLWRISPRRINNRSLEASFQISAKPGQSRPVPLIRKRRRETAVHALWKVFDLAHLNVAPSRLLSQIWVKIGSEERDGWTEEFDIMQNTSIWFTVNEAAYKWTRKRPPRFILKEHHGQIGAHFCCARSLRCPIR